MVKKPSGEIGGTRISATPDGQTAELESVSLPNDKEGLERYFAERFISSVNRNCPTDDQIILGQQNDTTDLDFNVSGRGAKYLELAEIAPYSEEVGRRAIDEQWINIYDFSKWIWKGIIEKKEYRYGDVCKDTILLLYSTRWEFFVSDTVLQCIIWTLQHKGCRFHSVYFLKALGHNIDLAYCLHPNSEPAVHPREFRDKSYLNLRPGADSYTFGSKRS